jgi:hypothetical protein
MTRRQAVTGPPSRWTQEQNMAALDIQRLADASEDDAARRYLRQQLLVSLVEDAMRRADAMSRLDATLQVTTRQRAA